MCKWQELPGKDHFQVLELLQNEDDNLMKVREVLSCKKDIDLTLFIPSQMILDLMSQQQELT